MESVCYLNKVQDYRTLKNGKGLRKYHAECKAGSREYQWGYREVLLRFTWAQMGIFGVSWGLHSLPGEFQRSSRRVSSGFSSI